MKLSDGPGYAMPAAAGFPWDRNATRREFRCGRLPAKSVLRWQRRQTRLRIWPRADFEFRRATDRCSTKPEPRYCPAEFREWWARWPAYRRPADTDANN